MKKRPYRVLLRIEIDERALEFGDVVELDEETATEYGHALSAMAEEKGDGGHK